ncbi:MAG: hypothetical protein M3452_08670 [Chloroflexota bacterium]|nr:hypothetical protein [Chloroflexota bacterium]
MSLGRDIVTKAVLALFVLGGVLVFFLLIGDTPLEQAASQRFSDWEALVALGVAASAFLVLVTVDAASRREAYRATLRGNLIWVPALAAVLSTALYLADIQGRTFWQQNALLLGSVMAGLIWLAYPMIDRDYASSSAANAGMYLALQTRIDRLKHRAQSLRATPTADPADAAVAASIREEVTELERSMSAPGEPWVAGSGYIETWSRVQQAERDLLARSDVSTVVAAGLYDMLRLRGSDIADREALLAGMRAAVREIDPSADRYLVGLEILPPSNTTGWQPDAVRRLVSEVLVLERLGQETVGSESTILAPLAIPQASTGHFDGAEGEVDPGAEEVPPILAPGGPAAAPTQTTTEARGRAIVCGIHRIIDEYRNDLWANLVRARGRLLATTFVGGLLAYLIVGLALMQSIDERLLVGAWLLYFAGALAGLLQQLYLASQADVAVEDYGLDQARLFATPLLSGMAAIIGVVLTLAASGPLSALLASSGNEAAATIPDAVELLMVFDLEQRPVAILLAFLFGFAPHLVLRRLNQQADAAKVSLKTSEAG